MNSIICLLHCHISLPILLVHLVYIPITLSNPEHFQISSESTISRSLTLSLYHVRLWARDSSRNSKKQLPICHCSDPIKDLSIEYHMFVPLHLENYGKNSLDGLLKIYENFSLGAFLSVPYWIDTHRTNGSAPQVCWVDLCEGPPPVSMES